jgi:hypothetical protein
MRKLSNKAIVTQVLMVFLLLSISVFGAPSNTKPKTNPAKTRVSKKLAVQKATNPEKNEKSEKNTKLEVDQAQSLLATGIQRIIEHDTLECQ